MIYYLIGELSQYTLIEGCYIPFDWSKSFTKDYLEHIEYYCLVMSEHYIKNNFANIRKYANAIENRLDDESCTMENVLNDNARFLLYFLKNFFKNNRFSTPSNSRNDFN